MKYITSVLDEKGNTRHIIEIENRGNVEVLHRKEPEKYYDKAGERVYVIGQTCIYDDLRFYIENNNSTHLAEIVFNIEVVKFLLEAIKKP